MFLIYLNIFFSLSRSIAAEHISYLFNIQVEVPVERKAVVDVEKLESPETEESHKEKVGTKVAEKTVGINDPCPCGSGKKYKNCHGK